MEPLRLPSLPPLPPSHCVEPNGDLALPGENMYVPNVNHICNVFSAPLPDILHYLILDWNNVLAEGESDEADTEETHWKAEGGCADTPHQLLLGCQSVREVCTLLL